MKTLLHCLWMCLWVASAVQGQTPTIHTITGTVTDARNGEKLIGVAIIPKGATKGVLTDFEGQFTLKTSEILPLTLVFKYLGYQNTEVVVADTKKPLLVKLSKSEQMLKEVKVKDSRVSERIKQSPITVETMDALSIKQTPAANFYEGLAHLKGVDMTAASIGFKIINTRGFNSTSPVRSLQLIDGVDNQSPGLNFSLGNFLGAPELDIQRVDLIVGASSAYYGPNAFNGVINMQTKSPFLYPGLSAQVKAGERDLLETSVRWAQAFKNKNNEDLWAYKFNIFYMRAYDWEATNYNATSQSPVGMGNSGGYDAVNRYGDEYVNPILRQPLTNLPSVGKGYFLRDGYREKDLVDYNTRNIKLNAAVHYKVKKDVELIAGGNLGYGTTVYQGDNRFSLKDIMFYQGKLELKKENKFFIRAYATQEDAGNSYDAYATAILLQNGAKADLDWGKDYDYYLTQNLGPLVQNWYTNNIGGKGLQLDTIPGANNQRLNYIENYWRTVYVHRLDSIHKLARDWANTPNVINSNLDRFAPGTARFDSAFKSLSSRTNQQGGSRFFDQSALYHIAAEYIFIYRRTDIKVGGSYRMYVPYSKGTIFKDGEQLETIYARDGSGNIIKDGQGRDSVTRVDSKGFIQITNQEAGIYVGIERKFYENKLKLSVTNRFDKNQNFNLLWSPAATAVYTNKVHVLRVSLSSAIRNPTLTDQYLSLFVGRATLLGNLNGFKNLVTTESLVNFLNTKDSAKLVFFDVAPIQPERVQTIEFGYRGTIKEKLFADFSYYYSWYQDFIGYKIGAQVKIDALNNVQGVNVYRVAANAKDVVTTQGVSIGLNYFWRKYLGFTTNYSWNKLDRGGSTDQLIPAYNTPEHKYNLGINGRDIDMKLGNLQTKGWSYGLNWKWQEGFMFEGSPQYTGFVPAYGMLDVQLSKVLGKINATVKAGASNVLDNKVFMVYGGPYVGRMAYISVLFELNKWK